jgi:hypothetical protein
VTEHQEAVDAVVALSEWLRAHGYAVGLSGIVVRPDGSALFRLAKSDAGFHEVLAEAGFDHRYEVTIESGKDLILAPNA